MPRGDKRFARNLVLVDFFIITMLLVAVTAPVARLNPIYFQVGNQLVPLTYWLFSSLLAVFWVSVLGWGGTRSFRVVGSGGAEYKAVFRVTIFLFSAVALLSYFAKAEISRSYFLVALIGGTALLLLGRWLCRVFLNSQRIKGKFSSKAFLIGSPESVEQIRNELQKHPEAGLSVGGELTFAISEFPFTTLPSRQEFCSTVISELNNSDSHFLIVCNSEALNADVVQLLSWELEPHKHELILAPSLQGIHESRIHSKQVAGLSFLFVSTPDLQSNKKMFKRLIDLGVSAALLLVLSPLFLLVSLIIKFESPGPIFYKQERIGLLGKVFNIYKFRSMRVDADKYLLDLLSSQGDEEAVFSKVRSDPRLTKVGKIIRKYSIDELPQLINVLFGTMSLVGPRPHRDFEVAKYDAITLRRLLVKPGMTGLWQVSGRSSLDQNESMSLDLYYVENWSLVFDWVILAKTIRAVVIPGESSV